MYRCFENNIAGNNKVVIRNSVSMKQQIATVSFLSTRRRVVSFFIVEAYTSNAQDNDLLLHHSSRVFFLIHIQTKKNKRRLIWKLRLTH